MSLCSLHWWMDSHPLSHQGGLLLLLLLSHFSLTLCNPVDGSPLGSSVPGILQARRLEWVAISFSNAWNWKVKVKLLSRIWLLATPWTAAYQAPPSMRFSMARVVEWGAIAFSTGKSGPECIDCGFTRYICLSTLQMYMLLQYLDSNLTYFLDFVWDYLYYIIK